MGVPPVASTAVRRLVLAVMVGAGGFACVPAATEEPAPCPVPCRASMLDAVNDDREANGLEPVERAPDLSRIAQEWAEELARSGVLHHSSESARVYRRERGSELLIAFASENVLGPSVDCPSAAEMEASWMLSPLHRLNILDPQWVTFGAGIAQDAQGRLWAVQEFGL